MYYKTKNYYGKENAPFIFYILGGIGFILCITFAIINFSQDRNSVEVNATVHHEYSYEYSAYSRRSRNTDTIYVTYVYNGIRYENRRLSHVVTPGNYPEGSTMTVKILPTRPENCYIDTGVISLPVYCGVFALVMILMGIFFTPKKALEEDVYSTPPEDDQFSYFYEQR